MLLKQKMPQPTWNGLRQENQIGYWLIPLFGEYYIWCFKYCSIFPMTIFLADEAPFFPKLNLYPTAPINMFSICKINDCLESIYLLSPSAVVYPRSFSGLYKSDIFCLEPANGKAVDNKTYNIPILDLNYYKRCYLSFEHLLQ